MSDRPESVAAPVVGYVPGGFDMLHVGHINILTAARERCSHLVVGVATDESLERMKGRLPVVPHAERMKLVEALRFVDEEGTDGLKPYLLVRGRLEALVARPVMYELAELGEEIDVDGRAMFAVRSKGAVFPIMPADTLKRLSA